MYVENRRLFIIFIGLFLLCVAFGIGGFGIGRVTAVRPTPGYSGSDGGHGEAVGRVDDFLRELDTGLESMEIVISSVASGLRDSPTELRGLANEIRIIAGRVATLEEDNASLRRRIRDFRNDNFDTVIDEVENEE